MKWAEGGLTPVGLPGQNYLKLLKNIIIIK